MDKIKLKIEATDISEFTFTVIGETDVLEASDIELVRKYLGEEELTEEEIDAAEDIEYDLQSFVTWGLADRIIEDSEYAETILEDMTILANEFLEHEELEECHQSATLVLDTIPMIQKVKDELTDENKDECRKVIAKLLGLINDNISDFIEINGVEIV